MSPTHLNTFIDLEYGGPESFLLQTLLRFPKAPGEDGEFGNAIHGSLEWYQNQISKNLNPSIASLLKEFDANLKRRYITADRIDDYRAKGHNALSKYIEARTAMFKLETKTEVDFRTEGVLVGKAHLSGKIDRIEINKTEKTLSIVDFKTGKPHTKWDREVKLIKYKQQLYFYKFLIEGSHSWSNYKVSSARLEFVEPNGDGKIVDPLYIEFDSNEEKQLKKLIENIWTSIKKLNFPETIGFNADYYGVLKYIDSIK
jgi:RecB family exonuclease